MHFYKRACRNAPAPDAIVGRALPRAGVRWREQGLECQAIWQRLRRDHGFKGGYGAVWRFVSRLEDATPKVTVRIEVKPGDEAQVDFGYVGLLLDPATGRQRKAWAFVMTLSWSRHMYVEFVFDQTVETWLRLHQHAFAFFGAVPRRIVLDNLKAAIVKACFEDPVVQRSYRELAEHYGFLLAPCRVRTPEHKGKVESGVHYVQRNLLGSQDFTTSGRQPGRPGLDRASRRPAHPRHDQAKAVGAVPGNRAGRPVAVAQRALRPGRLEAGHRRPGLLRHLREGVLLGALSPGRPGGVGARRLTRSASTQPSAGGDAPTGQAARRALHRVGPPAARESGRPHDDPRNLCGAGGRHRPQHGRGGDPLTGAEAGRPPAHGETPVALADQYGALRLERACRRALQFEEYTGQTIRCILEKGLDMAVLPPMHGTVARAAVRPLGRRTAARPGRCVMELTHELTPQLKRLRLSGVLETLELRNQQAIQERLSYVEFLARLIQDEVERRTQKQLQLRVRRRPSAATRRWRASTSASTRPSTASNCSTWRPVTTSPSIATYWSADRPGSGKVT